MNIFPWLVKKIDYFMDYASYIITVLCFLLLITIPVSCSLAISSENKREYKGTEKDRLDRIETIVASFSEKLDNLEITLPVHCASCANPLAENSK